MTKLENYGILKHQLLSSINSKCLHLNDCFDYRNHVCMVFDLLGQSIYDWLKDNSFCPFPPNQVQYFARQLLTSVACMALGHSFCR